LVPPLAAFGVIFFSAIGSSSCARGPRRPFSTHGSCRIGHRSSVVAVTRHACRSSRRSL
jgi:hypothetical protein